MVANRLPVGGNAQTQSYNDAVFDLSPIKILLIVAVILIVLGPDKLPQAAHQIGSAWKSLQQWRERIEKEIRDVVPDLPSSADIARIARSPVNLLNSLADRVESADGTGAPAADLGPTLVRHDNGPPPEPEPAPGPDVPPVRTPWSVPSVGDPSLN